MTTTKFGLAQPVRRVEDPRLLKGAGRYTDDIVLPGMLFGVVLRSPHAAAKITPAGHRRGGEAAGRRGHLHRRRPEGRRHRSAALRGAGDNRDGSPQAAPPHPVLADGAVRHVGDPVAFIVAETAKQARDAAEAIEVDYDMLPSATDLSPRMDAGAPAVWPEVPRTSPSTGRSATRPRPMRNSPRPRTSRS